MSRSFPIKGFNSSMVALGLTPLALLPFSLLENVAGAKPWQFYSNVARWTHL